MRRYAPENNLRKEPPDWKTDAPKGSNDSPQSSWRRNAPQINWRKEAPKSSLRKEAPESSWRRDAPESTLRREAPKCNWREETSKSTLRRGSPASNLTRDTAKSSWRRTSEKSSAGKQLKLAPSFPTAVCTNFSLIYFYISSHFCAQLSVRKARPAPSAPSSDEEVQRSSAAAREECLHLDDLKAKPNKTAVLLGKKHLLIKYILKRNTNGETVLRPIRPTQAPLFWLHETIILLYK